MSAAFSKARFAPRTPTSAPIYRRTLAPLRGPGRTVRLWGGWRHALRRVSSRNITGSTIHTRYSVARHFRAGAPAPFSSTNSLPGSRLPRQFSNYSHSGSGYFSLYETKEARCDTKNAVHGGPGGRCCVASGPVFRGECGGPGCTCGRCVGVSIRWVGRVCGSARPGATGRPGEATAEWLAALVR